MTREEAIEVMRNNMPSVKSLPVYEAIKTLIPELSENGDERIRKVLISYFMGSVGLGVAIDGVSVKDIVIWLKKQKKQKED